MYMCLCLIVFDSIVYNLMQTISFIDMYTFITVADVLVLQKKCSSFNRLFKNKTVKKKNELCISRLIDYG